MKNIISYWLLVQVLGDFQGNALIRPASGIYLVKADINIVFKYHHSPEHVNAETDLIIITVVCAAPAFCSTLSVVTRKLSLKGDQIMKLFCLVYCCRGVSTSEDLTQSVFHLPQRCMLGSRTQWGTVAKHKTWCGKRKLWSVAWKSNVRALALLLTT